MSNLQKVVPPLKWAGGKRWLVQKHAHLFPEITGQYIEPFVGSGAIFFALRPERAILSDLNDDLMNFYEVLRDDWRDLRDLIAHHQKKHSKDHYYKTRAIEPRKDLNKAARFLYLNRTCWNGLYRVNRIGRFNVPIGTKTQVLLDTDDFEAAATLLKNAELQTSDFEAIINAAGEGDFVFADPPYTVKHNLNGFIKYNEVLFSWADQIRLKDCLLQASNRGAKFLLTNANHKSIRDLFGEGFEKMSLSRNTIIAADSTHRGIVEELAIRGDNS